MDSTLQAIIDNGLSVRQIPRSIKQTQSCHENDDNEGWHVFIFKADLDYFNGNQKGLDRFNKNYPEGKKMRTRTRDIVDGGCWMCQKVGHSDKMVRWNKETCHLSETLEQSVQSWLDANKAS